MIEQSKKLTGRQFDLINRCMRVIDSCTGYRQLNLAEKYVNLAIFGQLCPKYIDHNGYEMSHNPEILEELQAFFRKKKNNIKKTFLDDQHYRKGPLQWLKSKDM
jgi:hypothetical protein